MKEFIGRKIDEIRGEPEHVRVRYVWGSVLIVMVLLFAFWIMTLRSGFQAAIPSDSKSVRETIPASIKDIENQGNSITQMMDSTTSLKSEGVSGSARDSVR